MLSSIFNWFHFDLLCAKRGENSNNLLFAKRGEKIEILPSHTTRVWRLASEIWGVGGGGGRGEGSRKNQPPKSQIFGGLWLCHHHIRQPPTTSNLIRSLIDFTLIYFARSVEKILIIYFARSAEKNLRFYFARSAEKNLRFYFAQSAEKILRLLF